MIKIVNIRDIAKKAQVSVATVSHVINKTRHVSDELIDRVVKAMMELDYQPNLLAGSLRRKKSSTIGLIIPDSSNMLFSGVEKNIEDILFSQNYNVIVCNSAYDIGRELEHLNTLRSKMVDGVIIVPATMDGKHLEKFRNIGIPIIILDRMIPDINEDTVLVDNYKGGYDAAKYLLSLGHTDVGYIDRISDHSHSLERKKGFAKAFEEQGLFFDTNNIVRGGFTFNAGIEAVKKLLEENSRITAIFTFNDINAFGAIRGLADLGLKVPEDISVIGYDGTPLSEIYIPRLTTVRYPIIEMADVVSKLLLKRIAEPVFKKAIKKIIPPELIIRESTRSK
ncbi:MAG: LacI family transcriptional regulator [Actinobacteria bacterium]|nr:LacI family transcriptional regulator [Actinomycetota bacterium]MCL6088322.1 LacI family transcriptional regulator [Actinomycetota bacterium]